MYMKLSYIQISLLKAIASDGVSRRCRRKELCNITVDDIEDTISVSKPSLTYVYCNC